MLDRRKVKQSSPPGRLAVRSLFFLTWCLTLLIGGGVGVVSQGLYRAYRAETPGGRYGLAAAPYNARGRAPADRDRKAAIIIDDLGTNLEMARHFWELEMPVTLAVLPYQRYSGQIARAAHRHGKEVILHLPMQPKDYPAVNPGTGALLLDMDRERVQAEIAQQLEALPGCVGVSNHMGSLFTERKEPMRWVLAVIAERRLFFVDSLTTPNSSGRCVAAEQGVPFAQRTHFLDGDGSEDSIVRQLCGLVDSALREGGAVGIAHPSEDAFAALPKVAAAFAEKGIRLVPVSEMVSLNPLSNARGTRAGSEPRPPIPDPS